MISISSAQALDGLSDLGALVGVKFGLPELLKGLAGTLSGKDPSSFEAEEDEVPF